MNVPSGSTLGQQRHHGIILLVSSQDTSNWAYWLIKPDSVNEAGWLAWKIYPVNQIIIKLIPTFETTDLTPIVCITHMSWTLKWINTLEDLHVCAWLLTLKKPSWCSIFFSKQRNWPQTNMSQWTVTHPLGLNWRMYQRAHRCFISRQR